MRRISEVILRLWLAERRLQKLLLRKLVLTDILMMRLVRRHWLRSWRPDLIAWAGLV